jgi:class 3 adenylate cyclase/predicted negative regulator of RcsB-dependent stress response
VAQRGAELDALLAEGRFTEALAVVDGWPKRAAEQHLLRGRVLTMMGRVDEAVRSLEEAVEIAAGTPALRAECLIELATAYGRAGDAQSHRAARRHLDEAETLTTEPRLSGRIQLNRAALALKHDGHAEALPLLLGARSTLEPYPAEYVQALDATGACWAVLGDTVRARAFIEHAIEKKRQLGDLYGLAISYGQLGRLCLRLYELDAAEQAFDQDLRLCTRMDDTRGRAQCLNHLGQIAILRGDAALARKYLVDARTHTSAGHIAHAFLMKDTAALCLLEGDVEGAERAARVAAQGLAATPNRYASALLDHVRGRIATARGDVAEAQQLLEGVLDALGELEARLERLPVLVDLAQVFRLGGSHRAYVDSLSHALDLAEASRADTWVMQLERMLEQADPTRWLEQVLAKVQGLRRDEPRSERAEYALKAASRFVVVIFTDMVGFTAWSAQRDAQEVVDTLNDLFSRMATAVQHSHGLIDKYIGDALMVLFEGEESPEELTARGCQCALDMLEELTAWNQDRRLTERALFRLRIGMNAGHAVVGNMGSYLKVARSAVGRSVNLAARLESLSEPNRILCGSLVQKLAADQFVFEQRGVVEPKGLDAELAWWLTGKRGRPGRTLVG